MPDAPRLRPASPGDLAAIYEPEVRRGTATFELEPPDAAEFGGRLAKVRAAGLPWLVAELDGESAGTPTRPRTATDPLTASPSRTRSTSLRCPRAASADGCSPR